MAIQISGFGPVKSSEPIVGMDLGTTHSLIAYVKDGKPEILRSREGERLVPSVVSFKDDIPTVGYAAKKDRVLDPASTIFSVKRLLGRSQSDLTRVKSLLPYEITGDEVPKIQIGQKNYSAIEISALILRELKLSAEQALGKPVTKAVITVPAYFNDAQRQATRTAGRLAGLDVLRMIHEPTAAALAYGLDKKKDGLIAVFDLGGGTFDVSVLRLQGGIFEVLSTSGDTSLGGDDFDLAVAERLAKEILRECRIDVREDRMLWAAMLESAEKTKKALSYSGQALFEIEMPDGVIWKRPVGQTEFRDWIEPVLARSAGPCRQALADAGLKASDLTDVILVGGPTRLSIVQDTVEEIFGRKPNSSVHPDEVVALGAAIQADILAGNNTDFLLLDVVPLSLGIETYGGLSSVLISRNSKIPTVARETFTTFVDHQTGVDIHVVQGERERADDNRSLARFALKGIEPASAGLPRVEVTFLIDADGVLSVAARDLRTGRETSVEVRPSSGLTDQEVERMLEVGFASAEEDLFHRSLVEAQNEARSVLVATEKRLPDVREALKEEELVRIENAVRGLKIELDRSDRDAIRSATHELSQATVRLAELVIAKAIANHTPADR